VAETIGSLVDKISIVGLKVFHMQKQVERPDASEEHRQKCGDRLKILVEQSNDLALELSELSEAVLSGKKKLKVYRQFKMYNDPAYRPSSPSKP
jgi:hypothetical protein